MVNLSPPPSTRIAVGSVVIKGQAFDVVLNPEWARYFQALNTQVTTTGAAVGQPGAPGATGAAGAAVSFSDDSEGAVEFIPLQGNKGDTGGQGALGPALFLLQEQTDAPEWIERATVTDEAFIAPTLLNSWVAVDASHNSAGYYKDSRGIVHLRGALALGSPTNSTMFVLPVGYRPIKREIFPALSNGAFGSCFVDTDGSVTVSAGSSVYFAIDGITFRAAGTY